MKKRLLFTLAFFFIILGSSKAQFVNYEDDNGWNLGFNIGGVWQQNDYNYTPKGGISGGLTFGKSIYEKEGAFFAVDLRFRYLGGWNRGWATDTSSIVTPTDTFVGYNNYRLALHEYTLEGVLTLNRVRERTGILLYGFGGVGLTNYTVKANYTDDFGGGYNYSSIDNAQNPNDIVDDLDRLYDNSYETTVKETSVDFMPSLGFGIGYQFPQHFSMGVEHKITYALADNKLNGMPNGINDRHHYSAVYFRWNVFGSGGSTYTVNNNDNVNNYTPVTTTPITSTPVGNKPLVNIVNPATNNQVVQNSNFIVKANVYYVESSDKIIFKQNGIQLSNFSFDPNTNQFNASVVLQPGSNIFEVVGSNAYGSDQDSKTIILRNEEEVIPPPIITITNPSYCPFVVEASQFALTSTILNIDNANQIVFKFNGVNSSNFNYNSSTNLFSSALDLKEGNNTIQITATNAKGNVTKSCTINHVVKKVLPPVVTITYPSTNPYGTTSPLININGAVQNVDQKSQIKVMVNGITQLFSYNPSTKQVSFPANLIAGTNVVQISATNVAGSDSKSTSIIYTKPQILPPPVVTYIVPAVSPHNVSVSNINIKATVLNVNGKPGITVKHNGTSVTNFGFNPITKIVSYNANLIQGSNVFEIKGTNTVGNDVELATVIYKEPLIIRPPVVTITNPGSTPYMTGNSSQLITATILNVNNANNVSATFNGIPVSNFVYTPSTTQFSYAANLLVGPNTLLISGTNSAGTASKTQTIIYSIPPCEKPTLTMVSPAANPHVTTDSEESLEFAITGATLVAFKVNGQAASGYNFNQATGKFTSTLHLTAGATSYEVIATNACGRTSATTAIIYEEEIPCYDPIISFTNPVRNPFEYIGIRPSTSFSANVANVSNQSMVVVKLNGVVIPFLFDATSGNISGPTTLVQGNNTISISATNECGNTSSETIITYKGIQHQLPPPIVTITSPSTNPYSTTNTSQTITATILNVFGANNISAIYNGVSVTNFTYNNISKVFTYNAALIDGPNSLVTSGTNMVGTDTKTQTINHTLPCNDPSINFAKPNVNSSGLTSFVAVISNVTNQNMIVVTHNNASVPFTFNTNSGQITVTLNLTEGNNAISITATNDCGSENSSHNITYAAPVEAPCVNPLISVSSLTTSSSSRYNFIANVSNVNDAANVIVKLNGNITSSNFNTNNGALTASIILIEGNNTIVVEANECDGATETVIVDYTVPCDPVTYNLILPNGNSAISAAATYMIKINTANVPANSNISVTLNGSSIPFTFNANSGMINCSNIPLQDGNNAVVVTIGNDCSNETISYNITYTTPVIEVPCVNPVINISSASASTTTAYSLSGTVSNVSNAGNVVIKLNGTVVSSNYNTNSGSLTASLTLNEGNNTVVIEANECDGASQTLNVNYTIPCDPVTYNLILPNGNSATSAAATYMIKINTSNVPANSNISVTLNGNSIPFTFNANSGMINCSNIPLQNGNNAVVIIIGNECSNETISYNITYEAPIATPPPCENPTISLSSGATSSTASYTLNGSVGNITNVTNVVVKLNGSVVTSTFNMNSGNLSASLTLNEGSNTIVIEANECDGVSQTLNVVYTVPCDLVTYNLILPNGNSATSAAATYMIKINTSNVPANSNISVTLNGNSIPFTFNANSGMINCSNIPLQEGDNAVVVTIGNDCSNETISYNITYEAPIATPPPCENPTISLSSGTTSSTASYTLNGSVGNITNVTNVVVKLNGVNVPANFNINSGNLTASLTLNEGSNTIVIEANECDGASQTLNVVYTIPCDPVTYNLILPNGNSATSAAATYMIKINTSNVPANSNISVMLNGNSIPFTFNTNSGMINCSDIPLQVGDNTVVMTIGNNCSSETITFNIEYEQPNNTSSCGTPGVTLVGSVLTIIGTDGADQIQVSDDGNQWKVKAVYNDGEWEDELWFNKSSVTSISVIACGGDDQVQLGSFNLPANISGGDGDDQLQGGLGQNTIDGGAGDDQIEDNGSSGGSDEPCGPRFNPGNSAWQFCLVTPSGIYNRDDLASNSSFSYSGPATSVYFKPIAGGGDAIVNGQPYSVQNGQYYLFQGGLTVDVSSSHPGSMGHWEICVNANASPKYGNGKNRPKSPCEGKMATPGGDDVDAKTKAEAAAAAKAKAAAAKAKADEAAKVKAAADAKAKADVDAAAAAKVNAANAKYNSAIQKADMYYNAKKWTTAKTYYQQAISFKPNENHPKQRLAEIESKLTVKPNVGNATNTIKADPNKAKYDAAIKKADMYYNAKKWGTSKTYYQQALSAKPGEKYPKDRLAAIEIKMKASNTVRPNNTVKPNTTKPTGTKPTNGTKTNIPTGGNRPTGGNKTTTTKPKPDSSKTTETKKDGPVKTATPKPTIKAGQRGGGI